MTDRADPSPANMDDSTLAALKASIAAWEDRLAEDDPGKIQTGIDECPLCQLFFHQTGCRGCPVGIRTGKRACVNTPYEAADYALSDWLDGNGTRDDWRQAAQAEIDFLKSLLPEETTQSTDQETQP